MRSCEYQVMKNIAKAAEKLQPLPKYPPMFYRGQYCGTKSKSWPVRLSRNRVPSWKVAPDRSGQRWPCPKSLSRRSGVFDSVPSQFSRSRCSELLSFVFFKRSIAIWTLGHFCCSITPRTFFITFLRPFGLSGCTRHPVLRINTD